MRKAGGAVADQIVMTRYKGRANAKLFERDFPHHVEIVVPSGGLGKTLDAMYEFHGLRRDVRDLAATAACVRALQESRSIGQHHFQNS
jgi:hypothetical protein